MGWLVGWLVWLVGVVVFVVDDRPQRLLGFGWTATTSLQYEWCLSPVWGLLIEVSSTEAVVFEISGSFLDDRCGWTNTCTQIDVFYYVCWVILIMTSSDWKPLNMVCWWIVAPIETESPWDSCTPCTKLWLVRSEPRQQNTFSFKFCSFGSFLGCNFNCTNSTRTTFFDNYL